MSENLLHTKASKYSNKVSLNLPDGSTADINDIKAKKDYLQSQEERFYDSCFPGCNNCYDFIANLKQLFTHNKQNSSVFANFSNPSIYKFLVEKYDKLTFPTVSNEQETVTIKFTFDGKDIEKKREEIVKGLGKSFNNSDFSGKITVNGNLIESYGLNPQELKRMVNILKSTHFQYSDAANKKKNKKNTDPSSSLTNLSKYLINLLTEDADSVIIEGGQSTYVEEIRQKFLSMQKTKLNPNNPYSLTAPDFKNNKNNQYFLAKVNQYLQQIKDDLYKMCEYSKATDEFKMAIDRAWNNLIGQKNGAQFWEKGGVFSYLQGAYSEMSLAILMEYIDIMVGPQSKLKAVISDTLKSQQSKVDVTILNDIGIQVKNFNPYSTSEHANFIEATTNPEILEGYSAFSNSGLSEFLVNYIFNADFRNLFPQNLEKVEQTLSQFLGEMLSLNLENSAQQIDGRISFYFINSQYLVPGSMVLEAIYEGATNITNPKTNKILSTNVNKLASSNDDEYFNSYKKGTKPNFVKYWNYAKGSKISDGMVPMEKNSKEFHNILSKISIKTQFNYKEVIEYIMAQCKNGSISLY